MNFATRNLFADPDIGIARSEANLLLGRHHYLGPIDRGDVYADAFGLMVWAAPTSRFLPADRFIELSRWCILSKERNAGSRQWSGACAWLRRRFPRITTAVSYSDPSKGHTGALYRACNWLWAPTWHRLRPPPTGGGSWDGVEQQAPKDRWIFPLAPDADRERILSPGDVAAERDAPGAAYREPMWRRGIAHGGGGDFKAWVARQVLR